MPSETAVVEAPHTPPVTFAAGAARPCVARALAAAVSAAMVATAGVVPTPAVEMSAGATEAARPSPEARTAKRRRQMMSPSSRSSADLAAAHVHSVNSSQKVAM